MRGTAAASRNGHARQVDQRLEVYPGRDDDSQPFQRKSDGIEGVTKSALLGHDTGGYRWIAALGGEPDLNRPYAQHPWVYACVSAISRAASSVPARMERMGVNGEREAIVGTELASVLEIPNPLQSQRKFFRSIATSQMLYGETFLILLKRGPHGQMVPVDAIGTPGMMARIDAPEEIWPVRGDLVEAVIDPTTKLPGAWRFNTNTGYVDYPAHSVVQVAEVNPYNPLRGMGPMQAAYRTAAKDFVIDRYDEALLQNGGSPGGVLTIDGPLTDSDQRAIREAWQEAHGRPEQSRKTAVLPMGTTYKEIGMTPQAMEHEKLRAWDRTAILSIFGVPPVVLGLETMNYATAREQARIFWETTILPYLDFLRDELQYKLIRRINGPDAELLLSFDISGVSALRDDVDAKVDRALKIYTEGHRSFREAANLAGWDIEGEAIEGADDRWVPSTLVPADVGATQTEEGPAEDPYTGRSDDGAVEKSDDSTSPWPDWLDTEDKRIEYHRTYTVREDATIEKLTKKTVRVYRDLILSVRKRVREIAGTTKGFDGPVAMKAIPTEAEIERLLEINLALWADKLAVSITPALKEMMVSGATLLASEISAVPMIGSVSDPFIVNFYKDYPVYLAEGPISTIAKDIHRTILGQLVGADVGAFPSLSDAIKATLGQIESELTGMLGGVGARADRVARTETAKANNGARLEEMKLNGVTHHVWLTSRDDHVRSLHQILDGEVARVGDPFSNGIAFPGAGPGRAEEVVNCRCTTIAQITSMKP